MWSQERPVSSNDEFGLLSSEKPPVMIVHNLDAWLASVYQYWYRSGFSTMVAAGLTHVFTLAFTIGLSSFLFAFVDWHELAKCHDENSCKEISNYVRRDSFLHEKRQRIRDGLALTYFIVFGFYWLWSCCAMFWSLCQAYEMRNFYILELGYYSERHVQAVHWNDVVRRLGELEAKGRAPWRAFQTAAGARGNEDGRISAHDIACRIMRKENYLIAMLNSGILDLIQGTTRPGLTKTLEWSLHFCILDHVFGPGGKRRPNAEDVQSLKRRFMLAGITHIILMPFVAAFMAMRFFLMHAQEWRDQKRYLGPRQWSPVARWAFRELNELPHGFESRLNKAKKYADAYLRLFPRPLIATLARCVTFVSGAILATLVAVAAVQGDAILLYVTICERNLVWYIGIFSATFAAARALLEDRTQIDTDDTDQHNGAINQVDESKNSTQVKDDFDRQVFEHAMARVAKFTHCFPEEWRGHCHTITVRDAFAHAFRYKAWLLFDELTSVVLAPFILCFLLPRSAQDIIEFVKRHTVQVDGLGAVLSHSLFDAYADLSLPTDSTALHDKMTTSYMHFQQAHPEFLGASTEESGPSRRYDEGYRPPDLISPHTASVQASQIPPAMEIEFQHLTEGSLRSDQPDFLSGGHHHGDHNPMEDPLSPI